MVYLVYFTVFLIQAAWGLEAPQSPPYEGPPKVTITEQEVNVVLGENRSITCTPEGSPLPAVQWVKANGEFRDGVIQEKNTLIILEARDEDEGHYLCRAIVEGTTVWTDYTVVHVVEKPPTTPAPTPAPSGPPKVTVSAKEVNVTKGENGTITCTPEGLPLPKAEWVKANGEFRDGIRQDGNTLIILSAREEDEGHYLCRGIVEGTTVWIDYSVIHVVDNSPQPTPGPLGLPKVVVNEREADIIEGDNKTITCTPQGFPLPTVQWEKANGDFGVGVKQEGNDLIITNAQKEDENLYWCRGVILGVTVSFDYSDVRVVEKKPPTPPTPVSPPIVTVTDREVKIVRGENGTISCKPEGFPLPRVQWAKANGEFRDGVTQNGNTLIITGARDEDTSHYVCRGIVEGTTVWTDYAVVEVIDKPQEPPKVTISEKTVKIPEGESRTIDCTPEGNPLPQVWWTKSNGSFRYGVGRSGNMLVIPSAQIEDRGLYVCSGIVDGKVVCMDYTIVEIIASPPPPPPSPIGPPKVTVSEQEVKIPRGTAKTLYCTPEGTPLPKVQWAKANGEFRDGVEQSGNSLTIINAQKDDQAFYVCQGTVEGTVIWTDYSKVEVVDTI